MNKSPQPNLLLEVGVEELPHQELDRAREQLAEHLSRTFEKNGIDIHSKKTYSTPRRLAFQAHASKKSTPTSNEAIGPLWDIAVKENQWTRAGEGFLRRNGFDKEAIRKLDPKGITLTAGNRPPNLTANSVFKLHRGDKELLMVYKKESVEDLGDLLGRIVSEALKQMHFAKSMHWPQNDGVPFLRPIRWLCALLNEDVIPFQFAGVESDNTSFGWGHYFGDPDKEPLVVPHAKAYEATLKRNGVVPSAEERREIIANSLADHYIEALQKHSKDSKRPIPTREEVFNTLKESPMVKFTANLVEYPTVCEATFKEAFLGLPVLVIKSEIQEHQKAFPGEPLLDGQEKYTQNNFYFVSNNGDKKHIREGNEHVLNARLSDGLFLFKKDMAVKESEWEERLSNLIEHPELGSYYDQITRQQHLAKAILPKFEGLATLLSAIRILKWDMASEMVAEFHHLQGYMSPFYARLVKEDGEGRGTDPLYFISRNLGKLDEKDKKCFAIQSYYSFVRYRKEAFDSYLTSHGWLLGIVDLLDTLMSRMAIGIKATGSHDPYGLRRSAINLAHLLIQAKQPDITRSFDLAEEGVRRASPLYEEHYKKHGYKDNAEFAEAVIRFIKSRLKDAYKEHGFSASDVAVCLRGDKLDLLDLYSKLTAFSLLRKEGKLDDLRHMLKRIKNITEPVKETGDVDPSLFGAPEEGALHRHHEAKKKALEDFYRHRRYTIMFAHIIEYERPLKVFFDHVMVNVEDYSLRNNRVALLWGIRKTINLYVDFEELLILK